MASPMYPAEDLLTCCSLMVVSMLVAYGTKKYHFSYLPEAAAAMLLGMLVGGMHSLIGKGKGLRFNPEAFFYGLLPLIIFNAGYSLKKKDFFRNFITIILFAVAGTVVSALVFGLLIYALYEIGFVSHMDKNSPLLEAMMFGSLISAIDPVATLSIFQDVSAPSLLYNIVFGESVLNDASAIVLFRTFESFMNDQFSIATIGVALVWFCVNTVGSILIGFTVSLACAYILQNIDQENEYSKFELGFILLSAYFAYLLAEILSLSGIMALFFCGICNAHYGYYNISQVSKTTTRFAFEALAFLAEIFLFAYLGMQVVVLRHVVDKGLMIAAIPLCLLSRAVNIFPLAYIANKGRVRPITMEMKLMMWLCGLRGAVSYALAVNMPTDNRAIETTTLFIVVFTTLVFGCATAPTMRYLHLVPSTSATAGFTSLDALLDRGAGDWGLSGPNDDSGWGPPSGPHRLFKWMDDNYLKPVFGGRRDREDQIPFIRDAQRSSSVESLGIGAENGEGGLVLGDNANGLSDDEEFRRSPELRSYELLNAADDMVVRQGGPVR
ncbi:hypothetical protein CBR_g31696 [Chara braunii]|uniref:Sodium/hydrogen exchanger n=1 Tax=Chara braunii TaxID=69332 RepID=A0A388JXZ1_CHABU|nr:hypothetical protein CBR_g31696 [Chara braunii]|eukprot:GBG62679.1 hypothetical protein CBR_g31696 [Chara braunii]